MEQKKLKDLQYIHICTILLSAIYKCYKLRKQTVQQQELPWGPFLLLGIASEILQSVPKMELQEVLGSLCVYIS